MFTSIFWALKLTCRTMLFFIAVNINHINTFKQIMQEATSVAGDAAALSFMRVAHGNIKCHILQVTWK